MSARPPFPLALSLRIVDLVALLVPAAERADFRREWRAELWHRCDRLSRRGQLTRQAGTLLVLRCCGALFDALDLRLGGADGWAVELEGILSRWNRRVGATAAALLCVTLGIAGEAMVVSMARVTMDKRAAAWQGLGGDVRSMLLAVAGLWSVWLLVAAALAARSLLSVHGPTPGWAPVPARTGRRARLLEAGLVALVSLWLARWLTPLALDRLLAGFAAGAPEPALAHAAGEHLALTVLGVWSCASLLFAVLHARGPVPLRR